MLHIGCHLSASAGFLAMGKVARSIGADTFQFFTRNPRGSRAKAMNPADAAALMAFCDTHNMAPLLAHAPYTLNPCSADAHIREFAHMTMADDLARMEYLPGNMYNFHPGSHVGQGVDVGIEQISALLNDILSPTQTTTVLLETMAGKGSEIGGEFTHLRRIIDNLNLPDKVGVCLDTCHVYDAGYDIVLHLDDVLEEFDRVVGLPRLRAIHINDSMNPKASHKDRHQKIGEGAIGLNTFIRIINHKQLRDLPFFLETPNDVDGYAAEIALLRGVYA